MPNPTPNPTFIMPGRRPVLVLDVDGTLCTMLSELPARWPPECPNVPFMHLGTLWYHCFLPYLGPMLRHLLKLGVRIVFFSSAGAERNQPVFTALVDQLLGEAEAARLREEGQFAILSRDSLRPANPARGEMGNNVKDMRQVIRPGEELDDIVLVEDQPSYTAADQLPCLRALDLAYWLPGVSDRDVGAYRKNYAKNGAAWITGLIDTLLTDKPYRDMPLRTALADLLISRFGTQEWDPFGRRDDRDQHALLCRGLEIIRLEMPEAIYFGEAGLSALSGSPGTALHSRAEAEAICDRHLADQSTLTPTLPAFLDQLETRTDLAEATELQEKRTKLQALLQELERARRPD